MKVALAFFGIPRNSRVCYPSIVGNVLSSLPPGSDVQCFYHFYKLSNVVNPRSGENALLSEDNYADFGWMTGMLEPAGECLSRWGFDAIKMYGDTWNDEYVSIRNLVHQLNSMYEVTQLVRSFSPDVVVYLRPDLVYHDAIPAYAINAVLDESRAVFIPNWQWWGGVNDRFAICGRDMYLSYGQRIREALNFCEDERRSLHSERLLKYVLLKGGAKVCTLNVRASRVRVDGTVVDESFSPRRAMGRRENRYFHFFSALRSGLYKLRFG